MNYRTVIVGVGNEFRSDDAVGLLCIRKLREILNKRTNNIFLFENNGNLLNLLTFVEPTDRFFLIDAAQSSNLNDVGKIIKITLDAIEKLEEINLYSSHSINIREFLILAQTLNRLPKYGSIIVIFSNNFKFGTELSNNVKMAMNSVIDMMLNEIEQNHS